MPVPAIRTSMGTPQTTSDTLPTRALSDASALASIACFPRKMAAVGKSSASRSLATTFVGACLASDRMLRRPSGGSLARQAPTRKGSSCRVTGSCVAFSCYTRGMRHQQYVEQVFSLTDHWVDQARRVPSPNFNERPANMPIDLLVIHNISLPPQQFGGPWIDDFFRNA